MAPTFLSSSFQPQWSIHGVSVLPTARAPSRRSVPVVLMGLFAAIGGLGLVLGAAPLAALAALGATATVAVERRYFRALWWRHHYPVAIGIRGVEIGPRSPTEPALRLSWSEIDEVVVTLRPHAGIVLHTSTGDHFLPMHHTPRQLDRLAELLSDLAFAEREGQAPGELLALMQSSAEVVGDGDP